MPNISVSVPWTNANLQLSAYPDKDQHIARPFRRKEPEVFQSPVDLLVLSATWFRIRKENLQVEEGVSSLTDASLLSFVKAEDYDLANTVRDHFSKKIMLWALKDVALSKFRKDLQAYINSDGITHTTDVLPLVFRLPEFYFYDLTFGKLKSEFNLEGSRRPGNSVEKLTSVKYLARKLKSTYKHEYWFKNDKKEAFLVVIDHLNCCKPLWDREFNSGSISLVCTKYPAIQDDVPYYKVIKWDLAA